MNGKYSIIGGDIHKLIRIPPNKKWDEYAWRIHEKDDLYWIPVENCKRSNTLNGDNKGELYDE